MSKSKAVITKEYKNIRSSRMITAIKKLDEELETAIEGQFGHTVIIRCGGVTIRNTELDCEFSTSFDDNTQADEAEITIYNLSDLTINQFVNKAKISITAGYGKDTGVIFDGYVTSKKTHRDGVDKVTVIRALDDGKRYNQSVESISYAAGTKASYILKDLCGRVGLPIAVFKVVRDYDYKDAVTVDGSLSDAIKQYATVCGVSAYVCKSKLYVRSLNDGDNTRFKLSSETEMLSVSEFEEEVSVNTPSDKEDKKSKNTEVIKGFDVEMLLQHRIQTASIIELDSMNYKGVFRVREGSHTYSGSEFKTSAKLIAYSPYNSTNN